MKKLFIIISSFLITSATAQELIEKYQNKVNGRVNAIAVDEANGLIYLGGEFTRVGNLAQYGAALDLSTASIPDGFPTPNGTVHASCSDGSGGYYIVGSFTEVGGVSRTNLARINSDGSVSEWGADLDLNGVVYSVQVADGVVYIGGSFTVSGGWYGSVGASLDMSEGKPNKGFPKVNGNINSVISDEQGGWYIGGSFSKVGNEDRQNLAHIASDGEVLDFNNSGGPNDAVTSLALDNNILFIGGTFASIENELTFKDSKVALIDASGNPDLDFPKVDGEIFVVISDGQGGWYIGGDFRNVGDQQRLNIAQIDASGTVTSWDPNALGPVYSIAVSGSMVYVGGDFGNIGGQSRNRIAALNMSDGLATTWNPSANSTVSSLAVSGSTVYVGGNFSFIGGQPRSYLAALNVSNGLATSWNPSPNSYVWSVVISGSTVYALGGFSSIGGQSRIRVAALNISNGLATSWNPYSNGSVQALVVSGSTIYVGGNFTNIGGQSRSNLAALNVSNGLATSWNPSANTTVYSLAVTGSTVYAGGDFSSIGGQYRSNIAALNVSDGFATSWNPVANSSVRGIAVSGSKVFASGLFTRIGGLPRSHIAAMNVSDGLATTWDPNANGTVNSLAISGNMVYAGGSFTIIGGESRNRLAALNVSDGLATIWDPNANNTVRSLAVSGSTVYAGGSFTTIGGSSRNYIAALNVNDGLSTAWDPNANNAVRSLEVSGSTVYVGGQFTNIGGATRGYLAALNVSDGLATDWDPNANNYVSSLAISGNMVYAGGSFTIIGGESRNRLAALNVSDGLATSWDPNANNYVNSLAISGSTVYAGGGFTSIGGQTRNRLAAVNVSDGLATNWNPNANNTVESLAVSGSTVYVGGGFTTIGGESRNRLAALNMSDGLATDWNPNANNTVESLVVSGSTVYAGGGFTTIGGESRNRLAALNMSDGLATDWDPNANNYVNSLAISGSTVYAGGSFTTIGGESRNRLAALNVSDGLATIWDPNANNTVRSLAVSGSTVYAGGSFTTIGGESRNRLAALNVSDGLSTTWDPNANGTVYSLTLSGSTVYAGGFFTTIGGEPRNRLAALNVSDGLPTSWNPDANHTVLSLAVSGDIVYAGGTFTTIGGQTRNRLAAVNVSDGLATNWNPNANNTVESLAVSGSTVYVGGGFTTIGGESRNRLAALNMSDGLATDWNPNANNTVESLVVSGSTVYAGGGFTTIGGESRNRLAALNMSDGLATDWDPNANNYVNRLAISGSTVYAGGSFTTIGGESRNRLAALNVSDGLATSWDPNASSSIRSIAISGSTVYAGGDFTSIGGQPRSNLAALNVSNGLATSWDPSPNNIVLSLVVSGSSIYTGGGFTQVGNVITRNFVGISPLDEIAPSFTSSNTASLEENTTGIAYSATADESVTFTLGTTKDESLFTLANDNEISFTSSPDFESPQDADTDNAYLIDVIATDGSGNATTLEVTITVTDADEIAPIFTSSNTASLEENTTGITYEATADESVTFTLGTTKDEGLFTLANSNQISFTASPDFEDPQDADTDNEYLIDVIATDGAGNATTLEVTITVTDADEIAPSFTSSNTASQEENTTGITYEATADESVTFTMGTTKDEGLFTLANDKEISFTSSPDFEDPQDADTDNAYLIDVIATDGVGNATTLEVTITVTDADEIAPSFTSSNTASLEENTTGIIYEATADESVTFTLGTTKDESLFTLANENQISFTSSPDFESPQDADTNNDYLIDVIATDGAGNATTLEVTITVIDADEVAPSFTSSNTASLEENTTGVAYSATADESVTFTLGTTKDEGLFTLANDYEISFTASPDFEDPLDTDTDNEYVIDVIATDGAGNATTLEVTITVTDADEIAPSFTSSNTASLEENTTGITYTATSDESVIFTLGTNKDEGLFTLANDNEISFTASPDFENPQDADTNNEYLIDVIAADGAGNATTLEVTITVIDADEIAPSFTSSNTASQVENTTGVKYTATADESVTFTLGTTKDESLFTLVNDNEISFTASPDFEDPQDDDTDNAYVIDVIATDGAGNATTLEVTITVTDADEIAPSFTSSNTASIEENTTGITYTATTDESVIFTLGTTKDEGLFTLANDNEISFTASPDFESPQDADTDNEYVIDVIATDGAGNATTLEVTIKVTDAFEGSQWLGTVSSDWDDASNWDGGVPNSTIDVLIPVTSTNPIVTGTASLANLEIQTGATVTVNSGSALAIMGVVTGDGQAVIKRKTNADLGYSIIGSPITDATIEGLGADVIYDFNGTDYIVPSGTMTPGKGYFTAFDDSAPEVTFTGTPNTGTINKSVVLGGDNFNIVSNPYAAAISRSDFIAENGPGVIDGNIWLWDDGGSNVGGNRGGDYIAVNNVGITSTVDLDDNVAGLETSDAFNGNIVSMQGFLVLATGNANISFDPTMQVTATGGNDDANHFRTADIQKLRMSLEGNGLYSDILIAFAEGATEGKDYGLDAEKYSGNSLMSFYSTQTDKRYAIQTLPSVGAESREVRLGMEIGESEVYTLTVQDMENMEGLKLMLNDRLTGEEKVITEGSVYTFASSAGSIQDRFSITFINAVLGVNELGTAPLKVFNQATDLIIQYASESKEEIGIYTLTGQLVHKESVQFNSGKAMVDAKRLTDDQLYILRVNNQSVKFILNK